MEDGVRRERSRHPAGRGDLAAPVEHLPARARRACGHATVRQLGTLVRYADDFVVMCDSEATVRGGRGARARRSWRARARATSGEDEAGRPLLMAKQGFDFLGCHLRKRLSGTIWEKRAQARVLPPSLSRHSARMKRMRQRVKELTPRRTMSQDLRDIIAELNPVLRGWGNYFRTGNAAKQIQPARQVLSGGVSGAAHASAGGRSSAARRGRRWTRDYFSKPRTASPARHRPLPGGCVMPAATRDHRVSRVREIRMHGLKGGH